MNAKVARVGIYMRCSTQEQSTELQRRELSEYAIARGWTPSFYDDTATGTNTNRPELKRLMADARGRKINTVLVWKLDRFARSLKDLVLMLQELTDLGVTFVSLRDNIDLSTAVGRLTTHLLAAFAEFEADLIRMRVRAGLANAKARGKRLGRPARNDADRIRELRAKGLSYRALQRELKCSMGTIRRALISAPQSPPKTAGDSSVDSEGKDE